MIGFKDEWDRGEQEELRTTEGLKAYINNLSEGRYVLKVYDKKGTELSRINLGIFMGGIINMTRESMGAEPIEWSTSAEPIEEGD